MTKTMMALVVAAALALGACGGGDGGTNDAATTTTERATTTATATDAGRGVHRGHPPAACRSRAVGRRRVSLALSPPHRPCATVDTNRGVLTYDAPTDTPESDTAIVATLDTVTVGLAFSGDTSDDVVTVIVRTAAGGPVPRVHHRSGGLSIVVGP